MAPLADLLDDFAARAYERTGRHVLSQIVLKPDAALMFGLLPDSSVEVLTRSGPVLVTVATGPTT